MGELGYSSRMDHGTANARAVGCWTGFMDWFLARTSLCYIALDWWGSGFWFSCSELFGVHIGGGRKDYVFFLRRNLFITFFLLLLL